MLSLILTISEFGRRRDTMETTAMKTGKVKAVQNRKRNLSLLDPEERERAIKIREQKAQSQRIARERK